MIYFGSPLFKYLTQLSDGLDGDLFAGKDTVSMSAEDVDVVEFAILCDRAHQERVRVERQIQEEQKLRLLMDNLSCK